MPKASRLCTSSQTNTNESYNQPFSKNKTVIFYSISLAVLLFVLKWLEWKFLIIRHSYEIYIGIIAMVFTSLGVWLALTLSKPEVQTVVIEKEILIEKSREFTPDTMVINDLDLSKREVEILQLLANGLSNQEIAGQLFISLSTVKTHNRHLFEKLEVKRRTQAVEKAKRLSIIP